MGDPAIDLDHMECDRIVVSETERFSHDGTMRAHRRVCLYLHPTSVGISVDSQASDFWPVHAPLSLETVEAVKLRDALIAAFPVGEHRVVAVGSKS